MRVRWAAATRRDLASIIDFISQENPVAAAEQVQRIERRADDLMDFPSLGRPGRLPSTRELVVPGTSYLLIYRSYGETVEILRVLHGARDWPPRKKRGRR